MRQFSLILLVISLLLAGCGGGRLPVPTPTPATPLTPTPMPTPTLPPVEGTEPSARVAAFYYPWYGNPEKDSKWIHWEEGGKNPPMDISSDYYPVLGAYSSADREVVAQHFAWLRAAGVGVVITSWWGPGSNTDKLVPLLLEMGERYGIKVAFLIEGTVTRTAKYLLTDVQYIYQRYGDHPAFYRTSQGSLWSSGEKPQGLFLMWGVRFEVEGGEPVEPDYWREVMDQIHALPDGGLMIGDETSGEWVTTGHFDGVYNYGFLDADMAQNYAYAKALPRGAWYIPGINPGFIRTHSMGYEDFTFTPRRDGEAYAERWQAMFDTGMEPQMVVITTFNEWHEGTQIEPAVAGATNGAGFDYSDYEPLPPDGYITLTRQWVETFLSYAWPEERLLSFRVVTTSDWTAFTLAEGGSFRQPTVVSASEEALNTGMEGEYLVLTQPLERAEIGQPVEMVVEVMLTVDEGDAPLIFNIARGGLGYTQLEIIDLSQGEPVLLATLVWDGWAGNEDNSRQFEVAVEGLGE